MENFKNLELAKYDIYEDVIFNLISIFDCIEGVGTNCLDWNLEFKRIGNYELISRMTVNENEDVNINFQINDRKNNHKNLFEWNYLYDYSKKANRFLENLIHKQYDLDFYLEELDFVDENDKMDRVKYNKELKKLENKAQKIRENFPKKIFGEKFKEFEKAVDVILKNEYNKLYNWEDIKEEIFLDKKRDLTKDEVRVDNVPDDDYYLYFSYDNTKCTKAEKEDSLKILGFYSLDINELEDKENISSIIFSKYDFEEVKKYLENGKSLKNWLIKSLKEIYFFELQSQEFEKWKF